MSDPAKVIAIAGGVTAYLTFLGVIVYFSVRWTQRRLKAKNDAVVTSLPGAKQIGEPKKATMNSGAETEYEVGGRRVFVNTYYQNRHWVRSNLRIAGGPYPWLMVYPEGKVERFGKAIGLNREVQSGDAEFDALAYLDTIDTEDNVRKIVDSAAARAAISELLTLGYKVQLSAKGVEAFQLVRTMGAIDGSKSAAAVAALGRLADTLPSFSGLSLESPRSAGRIAFSVLLIFSWILGFLMLGVSASAIDRTVDGGSSALVFLLFGGLAWLAYVAALVAGVRGRSYAMRTVMVGGFIGVLGIPAGGGGLVHGLNQWLDTSTATAYQRTVLDHRKLKGDCRIKVASFHSNEPGEVRLFFKHKGGDEVLPKGSPVVVRIHPGVFGLEWIEPIRPDGS